MTPLTIENPYIGPQGETCRTHEALDAARAEYRRRFCGKKEFHVINRFNDITPIKIPQPWEQFVEREPEYWETVSLKDVPTPSQRADAVALARELKDQETRSWRDSITVDSLLR